MNQKAIPSAVNGIVIGEILRRPISEADGFVVEETQ